MDRDFRFRGAICRFRSRVASCAAAVALLNALATNARFRGSNADSARRTATRRAGSPALLGVVVGQGRLASADNVDPRGDDRDLDRLARSTRNASARHRPRCATEPRRRRRRSAPSSRWRRVRGPGETRSVNNGSCHCSLTPFAAIGWMRHRLLPDSAPTPFCVASSLSEWMLGSRDDVLKTQATKQPIRGAKLGLTR